MFADRNLLISELSKLVGIYQSTSSDYPELSPSLTSSEFRRFVDQCHSLIQLENIDQSKRSFSAFPYPEWGALEDYDQRTIINDSGSYFEAIQDVPAGTLTTDTNYWFPMDDLNLYLVQKRETAINTALDTVFNDKKTRQRVKSIYENIALYKGIASIRNTETNNDYFVGLRLRVKTDRDLVTVINKIGTHFNEAVTFNLYLYHTSQQTPIATIPINHTSAGSSLWMNPSTQLKIQYLSDSYDAGGEFYLGYAQSDLGTAKAFNKEKIDWFNGMCCVSKPLWDKYSNYIDIASFYVPESSFTVGSEMFDPYDAVITYNKTYGLNLNITTQCDLTPFFVQQKSIFAEAINYTWALEMMRDMANSTRGTNGLSNQVSEMARNEIFNFPNAWGTLLDKTNKALDGLSFDISGLQSECLSCNQPTSGDGDNDYQIVYNNPFGV